MPADYYDSLRWPIASAASGPDGAVAMGRYDPLNLAIWLREDAAAAIHAGLCDVGLILYGSTAASDAMAIGTGNSGGRDPGSAFQSPYGMTLVSSYAMVAQRHMHEFGTTSEQLADIDSESALLVVGGVGLFYFFLGLLPR